MPRWITWTLLVLAVVATLPFACIARARLVHNSAPRIHLVQDMDNQPRFGAQQRNPLFADRRAMRPPVRGTVARGTLREDDHFHRGLVGGGWATRPPMAVTPELMRRGQQQYEVFCAPCHGLAGVGDGMVSRRADRLQEGAWVPPASLHVEPALSRPDGHLFNTITHGIRSMPAYGSQIQERDRWAIVVYIRALQRSQRADVADVPPELRSTLR